MFGSSIKVKDKYTFWNEYKDERSCKGITKQNFLTFNNVKNNKPNVSGLAKHASSVRFWKYWGVDLLKIIV